MWIVQKLSNIGLSAFFNPPVTATLIIYVSRHGQLEDRDPYRLKDRNGGPVLCFRCGMSALPGSVDGALSTRRSSRSSSTSIASESWKCIVSCDHCNLHWHLDCLDPPLPSMPSFGKKWMCPNHADQAVVCVLTVLL
jgi:hypothetical protein